MVSGGHCIYIHPCIFFILHLRLEFLHANETSTISEVQEIKTLSGRRACILRDAGLATEHYLYHRVAMNILLFTCVFLRRITMPANRLEEEEEDEKVNLFPPCEIGNKMLICSEMYKYAI